MSRQSTKFGFVALGAVVLVTWSGLSGTAAAQQPTGAADKPAAGPAAEKPSAAAPKKDEASDPGGPRAKLKIAKAERLKKMVEEKLDLSTSQRTAIDRHVNDYIADVRQNVSLKRGRGRNTTPNTVYPPNVPQLRKELEAAEAKGDKVRAEEIRNQIAVLHMEPSVNVDDQTPYLIERMRAELKSEQLADFDKVVERWKALMPRGPRSGPFQQLRRSLNDPEVGLSEAQKTASEAILAKLVKVFRVDGERNPEKIAKLVEEAKTEIFEKLTPEQRRKVDANLKMLETEDKPWIETEIKGRDRKATKKPDAGSDKPDAAPPKNDE